MYASSVLRILSESSGSNTVRRNSHEYKEKNNEVSSLSLSRGQYEEEDAPSVRLNSYGCKLPRFDSSHMYFIAVLVTGLATNISFLNVSRVDPGAGPLLTTVQCAFTLLLTPSRGFRHRKIPFGFHAGAILFVFLAAFLGNKSLEWSLPIPVFILIKNGNLVATMLIGRVVLGRSYVPRQMLAVLLITLGIIWASSPSSGTEPDVRGGEMFIGVFLLVLALIANALLGAVQEVAFRLFGKQTEELMFSQHLFVLPLLVAGAPGTIRAHALTWMSQRTVWITVASNLLSNHLCKVAIVNLLQRTSSLHVQYATTSYRFLSIFASQVFLKTEAGSLAKRNLWEGTMIVLVGTLINMNSTQPPPRTANRHTKETPVPE